MSPEPNGKDELDRLAALIDTIVHVETPGQLFQNDDVRHKVDLLERALEAWRIRNRCLNNTLSVERFVQGEMFVDGRTVRFRGPARFNDLGTGTRPIRLQPRLLLFLLLYHQQEYEVYEIIEKFVGKVWGELEFLDFKKTKTGVTRCFTNTRFAAHTLRDYGLLKFTRKEAYKTWVLSLPGFLVASDVLQGGIKWDLPMLAEPDSSGLHPRILSVWLRLDSFDRFVECLARVCLPNADVFDTFGDVLTAAYDLLAGYWSVLRASGLSQKKRKEETAQRLEMLDAQPKMEEFYREFSACVNVERLLKDLE